MPKCSPNFLVKHFGTLFTNIPKNAPEDMADYMEKAFSVEQTRPRNYSKKIRFF